MPRKNTLEGSQIITAGDMSGNLSSLITCIQFLDNISIQCVFTGTPNGTFAVQGSVNHKEINGNVVTAGTFTPITLNPIPAATGAAGNILINLQELGFPYIQLVYTSTSSTGVLNAYISGKEI